MSRKSLRSQLDELRREKEQLESENTRLKAAKDEEAGQLAELENLRRENERLVKERDEAEAKLSEETELTTDVALEEQRQLYEDIQGELAEAVERGNSLEDRCSSLEDRLVQVMEESEVERLRAVEAVRSKFEDTLMQQVRELQRQVAELQSHTKSGAPAGSEKAMSKETTSQSARKVAPSSTPDTDKQSGSDIASSPGSPIFFNAREKKRGSLGFNVT